MVDKFSMDKITKEPNQVEEVLKTCIMKIKEKKKPVILFGAGGTGEFYLANLKKYNIQAPVFFCDNDSNKWNTTVGGIKVISFSELKERYFESYIIITSMYYKELIEQLKESNLVENLVGDIAYARITATFLNYYNTIQSNIQKFETVYEMLADEYSKKIFYDRINCCITSSTDYLIPLKSKDSQYFEKDIITLSKEEVFIDGGAYIGDTVDEILIQTKGEFEEIYSFEPETSKHKEFEFKFKSDPRIKLVRKGLWDKEEVLKFNAQNTLGSGLDENGNIEVPVTSIDYTLNGQKATYIKMDIEGAELEGLEGAKNTILNNRPKLAICVYHKPLDIVDIPIYIKNLIPDYKIYLRHYSDHAYETVCYAI